MQESLGREELKENQSPQWAPSRKLRQWLLIGTWAVAIDVWLSLASLSIYMSREKDAEGFSITDVLDLLVIIPEILVLLGFLALAREATSVGLWKSSIGLFGTSWLLTAWALPGDDAMPWWEIGLTIAVGIGIVSLFVIIDRNPTGFLQPKSMEAPTAAEVKKREPHEPDAKGSEAAKPQSQSSGWVCGITLATTIVAKLLASFLRKPAFDRFLVFSMLVAVVLLCSWVFFLIWLGISKIRLRRKLGTIAAVSGWVDLLTVAVYSAMFLYMVLMILIPAVINEQEPDLREPRILVPLVVVSLYHIGWKVLIAILFLSVRNLLKSDWREELYFESQKLK